MLPVEPGCNIDRNGAGGTHPGGDETLPRDGWAAFSGTSAAAPQIAGVVALMKQANPRLTPALAKRILQRTAIDVKKGRNIMGEQARPGVDVATGHGLVNAYRACVLARWYYLLPSIVRPTPPVVVRPIPQPQLSPVVEDAQYMNGDHAEEETRLTDADLSDMEFLMDEVESLMSDL